MARPATHSHSQVQTKETTHTTSQQTTHKVTKFDEVRSVLRDLEGSAKNFKSSNAAAESRIPLRHSSQPLQDSVSAPKRYFSDKLEQSLLTSIFVSCRDEKNGSTILLLAARTFWALNSRWLRIFISYKLTQTLSLVL